MMAKLRFVADSFPQKVGRGLYIETEIESKECKRRCPVDKGTLRGTIHVVGPVYQGRSIYTEILCGGPAAPYAVYVHEDLDAFHEVGQAKFIESVIFESAPYMLGRVAQRVGLQNVFSE